jgi:hypothetical protein
MPTGAEQRRQPLIAIEVSHALLTRSFCYWRACPALRCLRLRELVLDPVDYAGRPSFEATGAKRNRHCLTCFDLLWQDGADLRPR